MYFNLTNISFLFLFCFSIGISSLITLYAHRIYQCTHTVSMYAHGISVRTRYQCTHTVSVYAHGISVRTRYQCTHTVSMYARRIDVRTPYRCTHAVSMYARRINVYKSSFFQIYPIFVYCITIFKNYNFSFCHYRKYVN